MNELEALRDLTTHLQSAPAQRVIYLEGKTDVPIFFALLGVPTPRDALHQGVLVVGLDKKSGAARVRAYAELAARSGSPYDVGVRGITDGDGEELAVLSKSFEPPFAGPLFRWPAYCIENMLVKTGWPASFGAAPDWSRVLLDHAPYAALNNIHRDLLRSLRTLRLASHQRPILEEPLRTVPEIAGALAQDKHLIEGYDVEARFLEEITKAEASIRRSLDEGHTIINGKWLVDVFAPRARGPHSSPERCRDEWIAHAISRGGLPEVRTLWERITGRLP